MKDLAKKRFLWIVAAVLMGSLIWWGHRDLGRIRDLDPGLVAICFGLTGAMAMTAALKWKLALDCLGVSDATHFGSLVYYFMCGRAVGLVLPMDVSDFGVRTASLKLNHSISIGRASYSVYLDRTFDLVVSAFLLIPSVLFIVGVIGQRTAIIALLIVFVLGLAFFTFAVNRTTRLLSVVFQVLFKAVCRIPWIGKRVDLEKEATVLLEEDFSSITPALYALSGLKFCLTALRFVVIASAMGLKIGWASILLFVPSGQFAALFALTPGGLGVTDWSWSGLLYKIGMDRNVIVPYLVSLRVVISASIVALMALSRIFYRNPSQRG